MLTQKHLKVANQNQKTIPQPPTIALVTNTSWNLWNFRRGLITALLARGHRVCLLSAPGPETEQLAGLGATICPLRHFDRSGTNPMRDLALANEIRGVFCRESVRVCFLFTVKAVIYGSLAARIEGVQNVATLTGLGYAFMKQGKTNWLVRKLYRLALRGAYRTFFHNPADRQLFLDAGLVTAERSAVVPGSGVNLQHFTVADFGEAVAGSFLFVARLLTDKGLREYVAAAKRLKAAYPTWQFQILGPPDPENPAGIAAAELAAWEADGAITYLGSTDDIRPYLRRAAVVVLPSYREGCPRVLLEAAATGRPVITTDVPGCRQVVLPGKSGWRVPAREVDGLADAMAEAGKLSTERLAAMGLTGRELVENRFSEDVVVAAYLNTLI